MTDAREEAALEEAINNLEEAVQRIKATLEVLWLTDMDEQSDYRDLFGSLFAALAMTETAHKEAWRHSGRGSNQ